MPFMQQRQRLQQTLAHISTDSGRRLAPADQPRRFEIYGAQLGEGAAEVNEKSERRHK
jgi:hypothetical protein